MASIVYILHRAIILLESLLGGPVFNLGRPWGQDVVSLRNRAG